jgi:AcrR family transcriptional regulator
MPKSEEQLERVREESRERILQTALALFARQGYERTPIRAIAREAGISQGLMYNYFEGKEQLLRAIFARSMAEARMQPSALQGSADEIRAWSETLRREIEGALSAAGVAAVGAETAALFALIDGVAQHHVLAPRRYPLGEVTRVIVERYRALAGGA